VGAYVRARARARCGATRFIVNILSREKKYLQTPKTFVLVAISVCLQIYISFIFEIYSVLSLCFDWSFFRRILHTRASEILSFFRHFPRDVCGFDICFI